MTKRWLTSMNLGERAARHVARLQRIQTQRVTSAVMRGGRRPGIIEPITHRLIGLEPIAARTLQDAQLHAYLNGAVTIAGLMPDSDREKWQGKMESPLAGIGGGGGTLKGLPAIGAGGGGGGGSRRPGASGFDDEDGREPEPAIHFPQIDRGHEHIANLTPLLPADFETASEQARRTSFTVSRAQTLKAVEAVRDAVAADIRDGGTLSGFRSVVDEALDHALSDAEVQTIYRTYVGRAYSAGQIAVFDDPGVRSQVPYLLYSATHDSRVRPTHLAMESYGLDGTAIYRSDDPIWDVFYPPWAYNCRCLVIGLDVHDAAERGVREAQEWLRTGRPPMNPEWVKWPPFRPSPGWVPTGRALSLAA